MKEILLISTFLTIILFCSGEVEVTAASEKFKGTVFKYLNSRLYSFKGITYAQSSTSTRYRVARSVRTIALTLLIATSPSTVDLRSRAIDFGSSA